MGTTAAAGSRDDLVALAGTGKTRLLTQIIGLR